MTTSMGARAMRLVRAGWLALALAVSGLAGSAAPAAARSAVSTHPVTHPVSGLPVIGLSVTAHGRRHAFRVELAKSFEQQERGLMFRTTMGPDEGMLFPMEPARVASFWMKNTVMPLDIVFIGRDHRVLNVVDAKPFDLTPLPSDGIAIAVLELNAGSAKRVGFGRGAKVAW